MILLFSTAYTNRTGQRQPLTRTPSSDGAGLFCGVLRHLLNRGSACPKVLIATHFHNVFNEALLDPTNIPVSFRHMQIMFTSSAGEVLEPNNLCVNAGVGGTSMDGDGHEDRNIIGPGEKITYLYRSFLFSFLEHVLK
jgi:DNA mismatch repair protein MSH5